MTNEDTPPRYEPRLIATPKPREMYWCDFPKDAQLPEFWKRRPVIIISRFNTLRGAVTVIPCSTKDQRDSWAVKLEETLDGTPGGSWAVCNQPTSVAVSRLMLPRGGKRKVTQEEFGAILAKLYEWLPTINT
jgi:mRNA interferase MazF